MVHYHQSLKPAGKEGVGICHGNRQRYPQKAFTTTIGYCLILRFSQRHMEALNFEVDENAAIVHGKPKNWLQTSKDLPVDD
jgi:hypothetical protein